MSEGFDGVRVARAGEEDAIYNLLLRLHEENALFTLSEHKARAAIEHATKKEGGVIGVIDGPDGLEASIGLAFESFWYTDEWHLCEYWNFVAPEYRKSSHARRMINFAKWAADYFEVPLMMGIMTMTNLAPKMRLYQKQMEQIGALFHHGMTPKGETFSQRREGKIHWKNNFDHHKAVVTAR